MLIPPGTIVRLAEDVPAKVATYDGGHWVVQPNKVKLPTGYYIVPPPTTQP